MTAASHTAASATVASAPAVSAPATSDIVASSTAASGPAASVRTASDPTSPRQLPAVDPETAFFWTSGAKNQLHISRCTGCGFYIHPPLPNCPECRDTHVTPSPVSGRARVATFTVNHQRWVPGLSVPFVFAAVELIEQRELYVFTNIIGCPVEDVRIGMAVSVVFERHGDIYLPMFQPLEEPNVR